MKYLIKQQIWYYLTAFLIVNVAAAEVYQWVDSQGQRHYSDRPRQGAEVIEIHPGYSFNRVKRIYDGDTVMLENGQKVRLLGINTPEVETRRKAGEAGGEEAKRWLATQIGEERVRLETDVEKKDKYGRLLAHVFTESGRHLNLDLVRNGLATVNLHPPNLRYSKQLLQAEELAEHSGLGIWNRPDYGRVPFQSIHDTRGWKRVTGTIEEIRRTQKNIYLDFSDAFSIKIARHDKQLFPDLNGYLHQRVEARGWLHRYRDKTVMPVLHPSCIKLIGIGTE